MRVGLLASYGMQRPSASEELDCLGSVPKLDMCFVAQTYKDLVPVGIVSSM